MHRLTVFVLLAVLFSVGFLRNMGANCEMRTKIDRALRELSLGDKLEHPKLKALGNPLRNLRSSQKKRDSSDSIPQLAKNIESFLQKVIPNHSLVQDLMGYITMPNPNARKFGHH